MATSDSAFVATPLKFFLCRLAGSRQSKDLLFPASPSPSFLTVPGEGFAEPFTLAPGKWILRIRAEGVLLVSVSLASMLKAAFLNWWVTTPR